MNLITTEYVPKLECYIIGTHRFSFNGCCQTDFQSCYTNLYSSTVHESFSTFLSKLVTNKIEHLSTCLLGLGVSLLWYLYKGFDHFSIGLPIYFLFIRIFNIF